MEFTKKYFNNEGFTLLELIVSLALVSLLLSVAAVMLGDTFTWYEAESEYYANETDVRLASSYVEVLFREHDYKKGLVLDKANKKIRFLKRDLSVESELYFESYHLYFKQSDPVILVDLMSMDWTLLEDTNTIVITMEFQNEKGSIVEHVQSITLKAHLFDKE